MKRGVGGQVASLGFKMRLGNEYKNSDWLGGRSWQHWPHRSVTQYLLCTDALGQGVALHPSITGSEISLYFETALSRGIF